MGFDGKVVSRRQRILRKLSYSRSTEREQFPKGAGAESLAKHQVAAKAALQKNRSSSARTEASSHEDTGVFRERCSFKQRAPWPFRNSEAAAHKASGVLEPSLKWSP